MAENTQSNQASNPSEPAQKTQQQESIQQVQQSGIIRKSYDPLVEPTADAFPLNYRSPYIPGHGNSGTGAATIPDAAPTGNGGQPGSGTSNSTTSTTSTQQQEGGK